MLTSNSGERLDKKIYRIAASLNLEHDRLRTWTSFIAICGALDRAVKSGTIEAYGIKGGFSIELRLGLEARASEDIDILVKADDPNRVDIFEAAIASGFDSFEFRIKNRRYMAAVDTFRLQVAIQHKGRPHQTVKVDLAAGYTDVEGVVSRIPGIAELGLPYVPVIQCVKIDELVAEKLHGATNPVKLNDPKSDRGRDLIDVLLLELLDEFDPASVAVAAGKVFAECGTHAWPPDPIEYPMQWRRTMEAVAADLGYPLQDADRIIEAFQRTIQRIVDGGEPQRHAPEA
jgi:hypothetical protein